MTMISKKLLILNIIVLIFVFCAYILGTAFINYPWIMDFWSYIRLGDTIYLFIALAFLALVSCMISTLKIKNLTAKNKFLLIYTLLCGLLLGYLIYTSIDAYLSAEKVITQRQNEYIQQAEEDIKNDSIVFRFAGGLAIADDLDGKIDSIRHRYGIHRQNTGCMIDAVEIEGQKKYKATVQPYLEKRNGKGWEERMKRAIEKIQ